jgi:hypothetical protein
MGYLTYGHGSSASVIKELVKRTFAGCRSQEDVDAKAPTFHEALTDLEILARPARADKPGVIVWHDKLGVVVDGWVFEWPTPVVV